MVCVCVCVFIKLHITGQPGPVKLFFQCYSNGSALWGMYVVITFSRLGSTGYGCQSFSWSAEQGKRIFPCPRSRLRVWSRVLCSPVPSRVSPLVLHTLTEPGVYLRDSTSPSRFPLRFPLEPPYGIGLVPSSSGHAIALPMAFTTENRHSRASSSQGRSINGSFLLR